MSQYAELGKRLTTYVQSRGGPAKDENGVAIGTVWPMMLEAAAAITTLSSKIAELEGLGVLRDITAKERDDTITALEASLAEAMEVVKPFQFAAKFSVNDDDSRHIGYGINAGDLRRAAQFIAKHKEQET